MFCFFYWSLLPSLQPQILSCPTVWRCSCTVYMNTVTHIQDSLPCLHVSLNRFFKHHLFSVLTTIFSFCNVMLTSLHVLFKNWASRNLGFQDPLKSWQLQMLVDGHHNKHTHILSLHVRECCFLQYLHCSDVHNRLTYCLITFH